MSGYIGRIPVTEAIQTRKSFTASAGQTIFSMAYQSGFIDVYLNGVKLREGASQDFVATNGTSIVLNSGLSVNSELDVITLTSASIIDKIPNQSSSTNGKVLKSDGTKANWETDSNTVYTVGDGGLTQKNFTTTLKTKLDAIEASATADQTNAEIKTAYEANSDTNEFSDAEQTKLSGIATSANNYVHPTGAGDKHIPTGGASGQFLKYSASGTAIWASDNDTTYSVGDGGLTQKNFTTTLKTKLDAIEASATADQTNAEIKTAYEANSDTNEFSDAEQTKLSNIATSANNYSLPTASTTVLGGVKVGTNLSIASGVLSSSYTNTEYTAGTGITLAGTTFSASPVALTTVQAAANQAAQLALTAQEGDVVVRSDENKTYMHNGGSAGTMADYTLLATPTDTVLSVNGATGAVTLTHDGFSDFVANEHLDWSADQGSTNIHSGNYTDTTYSVGDGGLTQVNFTSADNTKLDAIEASATADQTNAEIKTAYEANSDTNEFSDAEQTKLSGITASANLYVHPTGDGNIHVPAYGSSTSGQLLTSTGTSSTPTWQAAPVSLPTQTSHSGKYLTTNGSSASWGTIAPNSTTHGLYEHTNTISTNYSITSGNNAMTSGPITVSTGSSVTVPTGSTWTIV